MQQSSPAENFSAAVSELVSSDDDYVPLLVDMLLDRARQHRASDVHLVPSEHQLLMQWRIDGVLHTVSAFDSELSGRIIARLKVMAGLLTYRTDIPQEGRISTANQEGQLSDSEVRVTTFPTLFGEKAAVRLFAETDRFQLLHDLGLPEDAEDSLRSLLQATSGVILLSGPSGSGKTTTAYACLRELTELFGETRGLMTLEDPIEVVVPGTTQSQVRPNVGFDLATGLKSMMRQDPDVIMIGEIRDPETAESAFQAALTGHLVLTTFHAGSSVEAVTRLLDMGIEPYLIRSTLQTVVCQRLLRKACQECCQQPTPETSSEKVGDFLKSADKPGQLHTRNRSCPQCGGLRFHGRFVTAELLDPNQPDISKAILDRADARTLQSIANESGTITLRRRAELAVSSGLTYQEEVFRILGRS